MCQYVSSGTLYRSDNKQLSGYASQEDRVLPAAYRFHHTVLSGLPVQVLRQANCFGDWLDCLHCHPWSGLIHLSHRHADTRWRRSRPAGFTHSWTRGSDHDDCSINILLLRQQEESQGRSIPRWLAPKQLQLSHLSRGHSRSTTEYETVPSGLQPTLQFSSLVDVLEVCQDDTAIDHSVDTPLHILKLAAHGGFYSPDTLQEKQ